jgi:transposase
MIIRQGYKYKLKKTTSKSRNRMRRFAGCSHFVYNKALALQKELLANNEKRLTYADLCRLLVDWKKDPQTAWLAEAPSHILQQALKDLDRALRTFSPKGPLSRGSRNKAGTKPSDIPIPSSSNSMKPTPVSFCLNWAG